MAYAGAFVARSDLVILGSFLTLWGRFAVESAGIAGIRGPGDERAPVRSGPDTRACCGSSCWASCSKKRDRLVALGVAFAVATVGYLGMWFVDDLLCGARSIPLLCLLGAGADQRLLGRHDTDRGARRRRRRAERWLALSI